MPRECLSLGKSGSGVCDLHHAAGWLGLDARVHICIYDCAGDRRQHWISNSVAQMRGSVDVTAPQWETHWGACSDPHAISQMKF